MRALVTGGAGFIGSHIVEELVKRGHDVRVLDDLSAGAEENLNPSADLIVGDVADESLVRQVVGGVDRVFHQAAHRSVPRSVEVPLATDTANTHGTLTVLTAAVDAGVPRVIYASSSSIYGGGDQIPTPESAYPIPRSPYAVSKLAGELYCRVFSELYGIETVALRYFNVYGPRQNPNSRYAAVIPLFIDALLRDSRPTVHGDGRQSRDFTYVSDVVTANLAAATAPAEACNGRAYNVAGGSTHSLLELLAILGRILETNPDPLYTNPRPGDVRQSHADISAARQTLRYRPSVGFEEGIRETVAWHRSRLLGRRILPEASTIDGG